MSEEVYLSNLEWTKTHDNVGGVKGNIILKNCISYENYRKLFNTTYYILTTNDEIEALNKRNKEIYEGFMTTTQELCEATKEIERLNNIIKRFEKDLREMYITFGEFSEEYTEKCIEELKRGNEE